MKFHLQLLITLEMLVNAGKHSKFHALIMRQCHKAHSFTNYVRGENILPQSYTTVTVFIDFADTDYINKTETKLSRMMMSTFFIKSIYGGIRLLVNIYKPRKRSIRYFPPDLVVEESYDARIAHPYCGTIETIMEQGNCWSCWVSQALILLGILEYHTSFKF